MVRSSSMTRSYASQPGSRNVSSSPVRIHASPTGVRTGVSDPTSASNAARLAVRHRPAGEEGLQPAGDVLSSAAARGIAWEPPKPEDREILGGDDVGAEPGPPQLHERRILPRVRTGRLDAGMDREDRRPRHAVLQARPRRAPERPGARRQPLVKSAGGPSEPQDLLARELEPRARDRNEAVARPRLRWRAQRPRPFSSRERGRSVRAARLRPAPPVSGARSSSCGPPRTTTC